MKGPGLRLKGDVRRIWRCPVCGNELPSAGSVTSLRCKCEKPRPFMQLVEPRRRAPHQPEPLDVYFECAPDDDESTATGPVGEQADPISPDDVVNDSAAESKLEDTVVADEVVTVETPEEDIPDAEAEEEPPPEANGTVDPPPATVPAAGPPAAPDDSDQPEQKRKRRSRGGRRKRGRRRKADSGQNSGPESRPADS